MALPRHSKGTAKEIGLISTYYTRPVKFTTPDKEVFMWMQKLNFKMTFKEQMKTRRCYQGHIMQRSKNEQLKMHHGEKCKMLWTFIFIFSYDILNIHPEVATQKIALFGWLLLSTIGLVCFDFLYFKYHSKGGNWKHWDHFSDVYNANENAKNATYPWFDLLWFYI